MSYNVGTLLGLNMYIGNTLSDHSSVHILIFALLERLH